MSSDKALVRLLLWVDATQRDGPENMAVDQWLLETCRLPVLRSCRWEPGWGSCGYFVRAEEADRELAGLRWVRRWTGGGMVNHCHDSIYTLVVPRGLALAGLRGAESYRIVHEAIMGAMGDPETRLAPGSETKARAGGLCFVQAVEHDLVDAQGRKLAGAGQRRTRWGLLQQGSVAVPQWADMAAAMATLLADSVEQADLRPDAGRLRELVKGRYASEAWQRRR